MPSMTVTSVAMRVLRRRLQSSRTAPAEGIAKSSMRAGTKVRVRTSAGQLRTGQRLVLVLNAVILSATEDGYVVYSGDPNKTMHVARDEVKPSGAACGDLPPLSWRSSNAICVLRRAGPRVLPELQLKAFAATSWISLSVKLQCNSHCFDPNLATGGELHRNELLAVDGVVKVVRVAMEHHRQPTELRRQRLSEASPSTGAGGACTLAFACSVGTSTITAIADVADVIVWLCDAALISVATVGDVAAATTPAEKQMTEVQRTVVRKQPRH
ncbi:hypothetical protein D1007_11455 [Hordeum vulgare]|nr:hypothetical protein D1007_11455 [Hordeum vulgare]